MYKRLLSIILIVTLVLCSTTYVAAADTATNYYSNKTISLTKNNMKVTGNVPVIKSLSSPIFQSRLNSQIENTYNKMINDAAASKTKTLNISYKVVLDGNYLSIILYGTNMSTRVSSINTIVINRMANNYQSINSILGSNGVNYANKVIASKIKADKTTKYSQTPVITNEQPFYCSNGNIIVIFGAGKIAPVSKGVRNFEIQKNKLKNVYINPINYYVKPGYNVKMIPLRTVCDNLGYKLSFDSANNKVTITKGNYTAYFTIGRNSYVRGKSSPKPLEFAAEIRNGYTYVPISFFGQIMDLLFSTDGENRVVISQYTL